MRQPKSEQQKVRGACSEGQGGTRWAVEAQPCYSWKITKGPSGVPRGTGGGERPW